MERGLDELCARHDQTAAQLYRVPSPGFEDACKAMQRVSYLRDRMRLRLFAVRCCDLKRHAGVEEKLRTEWPRLLRASARFEGLMSAHRRDPRGS